MGLRSLFESIQEFSDDVLFTPFNSLAELELSNWWMANGINWVFMFICISALTYWMVQLNKFNANNEEIREAKAHGFLGKDSELDSSL